MKIIQQGRIKTYEKKFMCRKCETIFIAEDREYKIVFDRNEVYYSCKCPTCRKDCFAN